jgi:hypothetical protein
VLSLWVLARTIPTAHPFTHPPGKDKVSLRSVRTRAGVTRPIFLGLPRRNAPREITHPLNKEGVRPLRSKYSDSMCKQPASKRTGSQSPLQPFTPPGGSPAQLPPLEDFLAERRMTSLC